MSILSPIPKLHHIGIILPDLQSVDDYMVLFNQQEDYRGFVSQFQCWCIFVKAPVGEAAVELVVPQGGPLAKFNKGLGGLHHHAFLTDDIVELQKQFAARDIRMTEERPVKGAGDFLCNFLHPVSTRGLIVEYIQILS